VAAPAHGLVKFTVEEFCAHWISTKKEDEDEGVALLLEPTPAFYEQEDEKKDRTKFSYIFKYLKPWNGACANQKYLVSDCGSGK